MICPKCNNNVSNVLKVCPICDFEFNYKVEVETAERSVQVESESGNATSAVLTFVCFSIWALALIAGFYLGDSLSETGDSNWGIAFAVWISGFAFGMLFYGIGEIISLLQKLVNKK